MIKNKHFICPECSKRGVSLRLRTNDEDNFACRYCSFFVFTKLDNMTDIRNMTNLRRSNKERLDELR